MKTTSLIKAEDIKSVASLHKKLFPDHFLGGFSVELLERFYNSFLDDKFPFLVCIDNSNNTLAGFVLGGFSNELSKARAEFIKTNKSRIIFEIIVRPQLWIGTINRLMQKDKEKKETPFRLLSIGVDERYQGKGVAMNLVEGFESLIRQRSVEKYGLSVHSSNKKAIRFYQKAGFLFEAERGGSTFFYKEI